MKALVCEMCGSPEIVKKDGYYVCQSCETKYTVEEARKMMIEGSVDVSGSTVKVDNSAFVEKYLSNARRAYAKEDWEEVEKYYNMVEQNDPTNMEAVFFSAFGKAMSSLGDSNYGKRQQAFTVLNKSISVIDEYYEKTIEDREAVLGKITDAFIKMWNAPYSFDRNIRDLGVGGTSWQINMKIDTINAFRLELQQIAAKHNDKCIQELIAKLPKQEKILASCYVATAVYGSYDCPQVWTLRRFRDNILAETWYGRAFIRTYYAISPTLVKWFGHTDWFKKMWKGKLDRMVASLNASGVADTPYEDKAW